MFKSLSNFVNALKKVDDNQLVFIGCSPRTGSTLLTRILDSHSKIAAPCEITVLKYFNQDRAENLAQEKYQQICQYYQTDLAKSLENPRYLFKKILAIEKKQLLIIKHPRHAILFNKILPDFPQAKFIHLVRDARSVAMSTMFAHQPEVGLKRWYEYNQAILQAIDAFQMTQKHLIHYEALVQQPEKSIADVVNFLGVQFEPAMLNYNEFEHADDKMKLWGNNPPQQSHLHKNLNKGFIDKEVKVEKEQYSQEVIDLYEQFSEIRAMNEQLGYK